jgi:hypothetical protein
MTARWLFTLLEATAVMLGVYMTWQAGGFH